MRFFNTKSLFAVYFIAIVFVYSIYKYKYNGYYVDFIQDIYVYIFRKEVLVVSYKKDCKYMSYFLSSDDINQLEIDDICYDLYLDNCKEIKYSIKSDKEYIIEEFKPIYQ